jgi:hypothetical protein
MGLFKNLFSRTTGPILTSLGTHHPWRERIWVFLKKGDSLSPRGDNSERVKIHKKIEKFSSPEPVGQNQSNLVQIILG